MAKKQRPEKKAPSQEPANQAATEKEIPCPNFSWSRAKRILASLVIGGYLWIVLLGPLTNPIGTANLLIPMSRSVAPVHQALYLGHGYRFFNEPGPSHLLCYRITEKNGELIEGYFPDPDQHWPRLMYHRWFMLSETIFAEHLLPDDQSAEQIQNNFRARAKALRDSGRMDLAESVNTERERIADNHKDSKQRIETLVQAVADEILRRHSTGNDTDAQRVIELFVQERSIPFASDVVTGTQLDDPRLLSEAITIYPKLDLPKIAPLEEIQPGERR